MPKRVDLSLTIELPENHGAERLIVQPDGRARIVDKSGKELTPTRVERATHYERAKGRKYQARVSVDQGYATVGGLDELARLNHFIVIDTNTIEIDGTTVSVAFFIVCRLVPKNDSEVRLMSIDNRGHAYEFQGGKGNAEMLAMLKVANDTVRGRGAHAKDRIAFVTDCDLANHVAISKREREIYGEHYLPDGFTLVYASADTGQELTNKLIRFCDAQATNYLNNVKSGGLRRTGLAPLDEDKSVCFRYTYYPDLKIVNPNVTGTTITPKTKSSIDFSTYQGRRLAP
jgi:hypothetical protein